MLLFVFCYYLQEQYEKVTKCITSLHEKVDQLQKSDAAQSDAVKVWSVLF